MIPKSLKVEARPLRVLQSVRTIRPTTNPYIATLFERVAGAASLEYFSWRRALFGRYDVLHIHWPELIFVRRAASRQFLHSALLLLLLARLKTSRVPIVRTLHNSAPHEPQGELTKLLLRWIDRSTTLWITLNSASSPGGENATILIPHPHYREWFADVPRCRPIPGRVGFFGQIREYKNVERLLSAFRDLDNPHLSLRVGGSVADVRLRERLYSIADSDDRVTLTTEHVADRELVEMVTKSELIVLPYREMQNSGALLLALSLDRPVLVPDNSSTAELAAEVGAEWVHRYSGDLTSEVLSAALRAAESPRGSMSPDLSLREWPNVVALHIAAYRRARELASGR